MKNKKYRIVYMNTMDWLDEKNQNNQYMLEQRPHHILKLLAQRGHQVEWLNKFKTIGRKRDKIEIGEGILTVYHDEDVFIKRCKNADVFFSGFSGSYIDIPKINPGMVLYDSLDSFEQNEHMEKYMLKFADTVLATSDLLYKTRKTQHNNVVLCRNATFINDKKYGKPNALLGFKEPILLFCGALGFWCDIELLKKISDKYTVVMVGTPWMTQIPSNIHYLGKLTHEQIQAFYQHCDLNLLPFMMGHQVAECSNPIKMYEAMSHGKLTISTAIKDTKLYPNSVLASETHNEFFENIEKGLNIKDDGNVKRRILQDAYENTWNNRVDIIEEQINKFFQQKGCV